MEVRRYHEDDEGFKHWLDEHPDGYVLNCYKTGKLHTMETHSWQHSHPRYASGKGRERGCSDRSHLRAPVECVLAVTGWYTIMSPARSEECC